MAGLLEKITLKLDLQGFEQIQGLGRTFKKLETNAVLSQRQIKGLRTAILGVGNGAKNTIGGLNANNLTGNFSGAYWELLHNGEYSMVGIGDLIMSEADVILWRIGTW